MIIIVVVVVSPPPSPPPPPSAPEITLLVVLSYLVLVGGLLEFGHETLHLSAVLFLVLLRSRSDHRYKSEQANTSNKELHGGAHVHGGQCWV